MSLGAQLARQAVVFHFVCLAWIVLQSPDLAIAADVLRRILTFASGTDGLSVQFLVALVVGYTLHWAPVSLRVSAQALFGRLPAVAQAALAAAALVLFSALATGQSAFIYTQF